MGQNKFTKIFSICAFVAFATVSCWATAESLHLLLPALPLVLAWIITIGFFVIASLGSKMIVDSLNCQNNYVENRGLKLIGGTILLLVFWLICSMPTNTHTFFYRNCITDVTLDDLKNTEGYLYEIRDNRNMEEKLTNQIEQLRNEVWQKFAALEEEIMGPRKGDGPIADGIRSDIAQLLQCGTLHKIGGKTTTDKQLRAIVNSYRDMISKQLDNRIMTMRANANEDRIAQAKKAATKDLERVDKSIKGMDEMMLKGVQSDATIDDANNILKAAYATIKNYSDMVVFKSDADKEAYTADNQVTKTTRLLSVIDTWIDFIKGKFAGRGFIFWVIISILVDVAAFVFFDIAFKKSEY